MSASPEKPKPLPCFPGWLTLMLICAFAKSLSAQNVTLQLKDGDKISGLVLSQDAQQLVISNAWTKSLAIPLADISNRQTNIVAQTPAAVSSTTTNHVANLAQKKPALVPPKPKGSFHGQIQVGLDAIFTTADQQDYFGNFKLVYARPYPSSPAKLFQNTTQVSAEYQKTDGKPSADRAQASNKSDLDVGQHLYGYGLVGAGYDYIQKINFQYQIGPGIGDHLVKQKDFLWNIEGGLDYEAQYRQGTNSTLETFYLRFATDSTWNIRKNLKLTASEAFYPDLENHGQYRNDFASNLSYGFWEKLTLNLTALDSYNTEVATGVDKNRFEIRSSLGLTF